jgi:hypothetical protein
MSYSWLFKKKECVVKCRIVRGEVNLGVKVKPVDQWYGTVW